jgi:hypothetical protein
MIISIDAEKAFEKIQNSTFFCDETFEVTRNRRNVPQHNKGCI